MDEVTRKRAVIVDICNTLFDSNTTYDFINYCVESGKLPSMRKRLYKLMMQRRSPLFWFIAVVQKTLRKDLFKVLVVQFLKGRTVKEVAAWSDEFYKEYLATRRIEPALAVLRGYDSANIVLVSATLEPIAATIAANLGIERFLATELECREQRYTGKVRNELSGRKLAAFNKAHQEWEIEAVITDNLTDKELMEQARIRFAVCYNRKQEQFWSALPNVSILNLSTTNYRP